jgi:NAD(P)-dependent dehydrogenase (short-subunit alcohol dehydrogenase family)
MNNPFLGKTAMLFGGATGIGRAVAIEFACRGASIVIADINLPQANETAALIEGAGNQAAAIECDVTDDLSVSEAVRQAETLFGSIDIVMNNVGAIISGDPVDIPMSEWRRIIELNLFSTIRGIDQFLAKMITRGSGYIVNTASFAGLFPYASNRLPYVASKSAVIGLSESLAIYALPKGVSVSVFCPGPVATNVMAGMKNWTPDAPMRGPGRQYDVVMPDEAARVLADGMAVGLVVIPTHEYVIDDVLSHAASPENFIKKRIEMFAAGDTGIPDFQS